VAGGLFCGLELSYLCVCVFKFKKGLR